MYNLYNFFIRLMKEGSGNGCFIMLDTNAQAVRSQESVKISVTIVKKKK